MDWIEGIEAITFDFGNTLVPFPAAPMAEVVRRTADYAADRIGCSASDFARLWGEERLRQFAEDVPEGREADMDIRVRRVLARLRGIPAPAIDAHWDDTGLMAGSDPAEVDGILEAYAAAFVVTTPVPPRIGPMLARLAGSYKLGVISNWPLSLSIERFLDVAGWTEHLSAIVISHRVGVIKPRPQIFEIAARELATPSGPSILHVGDDLGADVVGAHQVGWKAAWVRVVQEDSGLPVAPPAPDERPDMTLDTVLDLEAALGRASAAAEK